MDDLISRAAAIAEFDECLQVLDSCIQELKELAALDAVQVVRCRDCIYYRDNEVVPDLWCEVGTYPDFYCAAGKRKEDEQWDR